MIGFVGLGAMGSAMVARLRAAGHDPLVWNRTPRAVAGARVAGSVGELAATCAVVLSCVLDDDAVRSIALGEGGMAWVARPGQVFIEHATCSPEVTREVAQAYADRGARYLDAPVTGGVAGVEAGTLTAMVGGDADALARATPVLEAYCATVVPVGGTAAGVTLKLVNQMLVASHTACAAEAAAVLDRAGIGPDAAEEVLSSGFADSAMLRRHLRAAMTGGNPDRGTPIRLLDKDIRLASAATEVPLTMTPAAARVVRTALDAGLADADWAALRSGYDRPTS
ncbi:NAD(P)-dependent oxidoreductase [Calidifontibacter sp. DB0510]|uniref:NAD(P)-dependent oxidoreductase n=1 Tax=Metallococcus carri TaxID=1656884 RepID=A0A967AY04_9MICO|nr:NAD(P)-dependent oxidoreductase [Metallococcus carri]NHN54504.1 NAD(P)-dependent oxidoreductase [Metallococcus carri]NOP36657.1 NAD(P)-dependent oxidoreductase [Calidifontibacter sp. DB2511S]